MPDFTKIILRQGLESQRKNVIYSSGEPIYVTDTKRFFIGDSVTQGGILGSNKFLGFATFDLTTNSTGLTAGYIGDTVFDKTTNNLYALTGTMLSNIAAYSKLTKNFVADDITTTIQNNAIAVKTLSLNSDYFSNDIYGRGLEKNGNKIRLSNTSLNGGLDFDNDGKLKIANRSVTNIMLEGMLGNTIKGNLGTALDVEDIPIQTLANILAPLLTDINANFGVPIGTIIDFGGSVPPNGYLVCDGDSLSTQEYPNLFNAIKYTWGGGNDIFKLPDLRRKTTVGSGGTNTTTLSSYVGATGGSENVILKKSNIPSHTHSYEAVSSGGNLSLNDVSGNLKLDSYISGYGDDDGLSVGPVGEPFNNIQPSAVVLKCIKAF
jgi:microcystin-dependent protein